MSDSHVASEASRALHSMVVLWMMLILAAGADPAAAADPSTPSDSAEADSGGLEEVVVTAQKRRQNLQDVGISITALSGSDMKEMGLTEPVSIAQQTPGLSFSSIHQGNATFNIRGVSQNDFADHFEPPVALYVDEAYVPHQAVGRAAVFDVDRIEVLRGPQGTLFGRNATGGLVHLLSRQPSANFESYVDVTGGDYGLIGAESAVSGPITDTLRFRMAGVYNHSDGWFKNRTGRDLDDQNNYAGRLILDWSVAPETTANLKLHISRTFKARFGMTPREHRAQGLTERFKNSRAASLLPATR